MLKYIDLFAGIGGFHKALESLGGFECVFASEIDQNAASTYKRNFGITPSGDISQIRAEDIPSHDIICAGFPCQPFSKGGRRNGFEDTRGTLFFEIMRIAQHHAPKYLILENVPNIVSHDNGHTFSTIIRTLKELNYTTTENPLIVSPLNFNIPVHRPRTFILAIKGGEKGCLKNLEKIPLQKSTEQLNVIDYFKLQPKTTHEVQLNQYELDVLELWNEFYQIIDIKTIGFPIWFSCLNDTHIPKDLPPWKYNFTIKNQHLYLRNKEQIEKWKKKNNYLNWVKPSHQKFEWQCGKDCSSIYEGLIQFRPSGIRVKRPNYFSTLVAMNHPQIIGQLKRRLTTDESKLLQSFPPDFILHENRGIALKQLGNAVNVEVVKELAKILTSQ